ncbi:hypothetical protein NDK47_14490 [Brevibacillus ruminantium]|uniref:Uncharacterized protein n=1 Tax=Brevibacillus ruminantium TaxID=2950604 RepID=A0ABY4W889_9BACL|nr:hypothetical protein [Brevibacillus ruminantium]USG63390.1 hypothetical protein NDK47_14490 [Brevibacillus ruminantium]
MYVVTRKEVTGGGTIVNVLGEQIESDSSGAFLLPGRLIAALKPSDLPVNLRFTLQDSLPCGVRFYQEDYVVFEKEARAPVFQIEVTSTYQPDDWDGLFPLADTLSARFHHLQSFKEVEVTAAHLDETASVLTYQFRWEEQEDCDLENMLLSIWEIISKLEEQGNARLWHKGK